MTNILEVVMEGVGETISELKHKIITLQNELRQISTETESIPELINSANLLRQNEHLLKVNQKNSELLKAFEEYSVALEKTVSSIFEIQMDLKDVLKIQSGLLSSKKQPKPKTKKSKSKKSK